MTNTGLEPIHPFIQQILSSTYFVLDTTVGAGTQQKIFSTVDGGECYRENYVEEDERVCEDRKGCLFNLGPYRKALLMR